MRKRAFTGTERILLGMIAVFGIIVYFCNYNSIAEPNQPPVEVKPVRYWQDMLRKPTQRWINEFGYNDEILVAYNLQALINAVNNQTRAIVALRDKVLELEEQVQELKEEAMVVTETTPLSEVREFIDSNEPNEPNETP